MYWDILHIYKGLKDSLLTTSIQGVHAESIGIDTWGNDFALLDAGGYMIENPYSYRDKRTEGSVTHVGSIIGSRELFARNGIQQVRMNTLYQLASLVKSRSYLLETAKKLLFMPDLLAYFLSGEQHSEYTMATISQLYHYKSGNWDYELLSMLGVPKTLFSPIIMPGASLGTLRPSVCDEIGIKSLKLIAVGSHDTGSAVAAVPSTEASPLYISSGTWSIIGTETDAPVINDQAYQFNFSNEGGVNGKIRLLKNVMGLWVLQEVQRNLSAEGRTYTFEELERMATEAEPFGSVIDPDEESFYEPADMPEMIRAYCTKTGQKRPESDGSLARTVLESLALKYRFVIERLEKLTGKKYSGIHIIGGGAKNRLLCQLTAGCTGKAVYAGPIEATAIGNGLVQLISLGEISDYSQARSIVLKSFPPDIYQPENVLRWEEEYDRFLAVTGLKRESSI